MKRTTPAAPRPAPQRRVARPRLALWVAGLVLAAAPLAGCVELSRTEKGRFGNPLQSHTAGSRTSFDADNYEPPTRQTKPWYQRIFDW